VDFYARLYMAQVTENFNQSVRRGNNKKIDGEAFLRLGEIYYDTLRDYALSQAYYDSAINALPKDYEGYATIKERAEILNEFVKHLKTIEWQDSLLSMATLDSASLRSTIDSVVTARRKAEESRASKKRKRSNRVEIASTSNSNIFGTEEASTETVGWYFGNPPAMAIGQAEFTRIWGNIKLEDNWRRSQRQNITSSPSIATAGDSTALATNKDDDPAKEAEDPVDAEFKRVSAELPRTPEAQKQALGKIEEAYFKLGNIYYFKLHENKNAADTYHKLIHRFDSSEYEPEVLYTLYLITKDSAAAEAEEYASLLKRKHPNSTFAKILINPDYLQESSQAAEKQKGLYKTAYSIFELQYYDSARQIIDEALALGETSFSPNLKLLSILIIGETQDIAQYQYALEQFIKEFTGSELATYAKKLLDTSRQFQQAEEKRKGIQFIPSFEEPHYFVIVYKKTERMDESASAALESFNASAFASVNLKTSNLILNEEYAITFSADLPDKSTAMDYFKTFTEKRPSMTGLRNHKFHNFVITKDNFDIFYRTKGLDEYLQFFEKNYLSENQ
jgi:hypothetical protein